jgi:hypothetical protein
MRKRGAIVRTPSEKARHTDRWTEIILRAVSTKVAKRWRFISFRGKGKGEWRGVVDLLALRKNTMEPGRYPLKRGDLFEIILIQMKGGAARRPSLGERQRLGAVRRKYRAKAVVLFEWKRGKSTTFCVLNRKLEWDASSCHKIFG